MKRIMSRSRSKSRTQFAPLSLSYPRVESRLIEPAFVRRLQRILLLLLLPLIIFFRFAFRASALSRGRRGGRRLSGYRSWGTHGRTP